MNGDLIIPDHPAVWIAWAVILITGGIYARRSILYGLITAVLGAMVLAPVFFFILIAAFFLAAGLAVIGLEEWIVPASGPLAAILCHGFSLWAWCWWCFGQRRLSGPKWSPGMTPPKRGERINPFRKRPW